MKYNFILFLLYISLQTFGQGFYTKLMNPSGQLTSFGTELFKNQNDVIFFNRGFCPLNSDSVYECSSLVRCDPFGNELQRMHLKEIISFGKGIAYEDSLVILVNDYYGYFGEDFRFTDSLLLSVIDMQTFEIKNQLLLLNPLFPNINNRILFNIVKYKDKYVISVTAGFASNYFLKGKLKLYPHLIWVNADLSLDTIVKINLPYGEIYQMAVDENGNLNAMVTQRTIELLSNGNENIEEYKGYVIYNDQKKMIKSKLVKVDKFENLSLLEPDYIHSMFCPDGRKIFVAEKYDIKNTEIHCWDKDDNLLWVNKECWRDEYAHSPSDIILCKNGDIIHAGSASRAGMRTCGYIHRISPDGKTKWIRYYGYNFASLQNKSLGNWIRDIQENEDGSLLALGTVVNGFVDHATHNVRNDSTWILRVDSMGCMEGNKCNDEYLWNGPKDWYKFDQLTLKHKEWNYQQTTADGAIAVIQQRFGQDTTMYDKNLLPLLNSGSGWARYKPVITKDLHTGIETQDSLFVSWMKEGRVFGLTSKDCLRCRDYVMLYDFTLTLQDTFTLPYEYGKAIVTQVDSISLIPGYLRKRIILQHLNPANQSKYGDLVWIEGIGSPNGILYYKDWQDGTKTSLTCYYDRGEKRYTSTNDPDCRKEVVITNYNKVLSPSNIWHAVESSGWSPDVYFERNRVMADSVLIGINFYHKVLKSKDSTGNVWTETKKYVRESNGQLWVLDSTISINEVLIMDINLHKGDEFSYIDGLGRTMKLLVIKADTIIDLNGQQRKVLYLSCAENEAFRYRWIEGIGPDVGVFSSTFKHCVVDGNENSLTCFYTDDVQMWQSEDFTKCWINPSVIDTTDMDRSTIWYSSSLTGNLLPDRDCELKIDITKVVRDTLIGNRLCRIIGVTSGGQYYPESEIIEYSKDGKMYFYEDDEWKLLYDFTAQVGDTVTFHISKKYPYYFKFSIPAFFDPTVIENNPYRLKVVKIDTVDAVGGQPLKRYFTQKVDLQYPIQMNEIIENVGSIDKLFGFNTNFLIPECLNNFPTLRCYSDDEISTKFAEGECDKLISTKDLSTEPIKIYPNPGQDRVSLILNDGFNLPANLEIKDIFGKVLQSNIGHFVSFDINTSQITSGLYFITIRDGQGKLSCIKKLIIQK